MALYIKENNIVKVYSRGAIDSSEVLDPHVYVLKYDKFTGFYLEITQNFDIPNRLYGDIQSDTTRFINTFKKRTGNTGILLVGEKGSGKTLTAKNISDCCRTIHKMPTILINEHFDGSRIGHFLSCIDCECVILIDEFEKNFKIAGDANESDSINNQQSLLSVLDGVYSGKKLFILTCNDIDKIDKYLINRPGRIYYCKQYSSLSSSFIKEFVDDNLLRNEHKNDKDFEAFKKDLMTKIEILDLNFDSLKAIVEEANLYQNQSINWILKSLNIGQEDNNTYEIKVKIPGDDNDWIRMGTVARILENDRIRTHVDFAEHEKNRTILREFLYNNGSSNNIVFHISDFIEMKDDGSMLYRDKNGLEMVCTRIKNKWRNYFE